MEDETRTGDARGRAVEQHDRVRAALLPVIRDVDHQPRVHGPRRERVPVQGRAARRGELDADPIRLVNNTVSERAVVYANGLTRLEAK